MPQLTQDNSFISSIFHIDWTDANEEILTIIQDEQIMLHIVWTHYTDIHTKLTQKNIKLSGDYNSIRAHNI